MRSAKKKYEFVCQHYRELSLFIGTRSLLEWDQQTKLPPEACEFRSRQITEFASEIFRRQTDSKIGDLLEDLAHSRLAANPHSDTGATILQLRREFQKKVKLPARLVEELAGLTSRAQQIWVDARNANDFSRFAPTLKQIFKLKRQEAEALGYEDCPYDALLDQYEPQMKTSEIRTVLEELRTDLVPLVAKIADSNVQLPTEMLNRYYPHASQEAFVKAISGHLGFDYQRGRLDTSAHPFCTELGPDDCRITTRFDEHFFNSAFFGTLHEAGHGMYEQGLPKEHYGLPLGKFCSLGMHESQSRLWENLVGRRLSFWQHFYPVAQDYFPEALQSVALTDFYRAVNHVQPSLIRVEADEVTYNLHIIIRFELEQQLLNQELSVKDLPAAWNDSYQKCLGITPDNDAHGVLQDVHWSLGLIGYFPTYALGNLFASQIFEAAAKDLGDFDLMFRMGDFQPLKEWLNHQVHQHGMRYSSSELRQRITQMPLTHTNLISQLTEKLAPIYGW